MQVGKYRRIGHKRDYWIVIVIEVIDYLSSSTDLLKKRPEDR